MLKIMMDRYVNEAKVKTIEIGGVYGSSNNPDLFLLDVTVSFDDGDDVTYTMTQEEAGRLEERLEK